MAKLVANYNGGTSDEYGTLKALNEAFAGQVFKGFDVVPNSTPNMTIKVNIGSARIPTGTIPSDYYYMVSHDTTAGESVTIATAAASPRIDYIVAYIDKSVTAAVSPVNNANNLLKFAAVAGTPSGSPVVPTTAQIQTAIGAANPYIILAQIAVAASATTITTPNIADKRTFVASTNGLALGASSYVDNGAVWSISSGLSGTMTAGLAYINVAGMMVPVNIATIASNTFTASQDTYVYVNVFGTVGYSAVANNAVSPTLPTNSLWLAIIVTSGSAITTINTGQLTATAPVVTSRILTVSDTNGFLIYPQANQRHLGYAYTTTVQGGISSADLTGLTTTVISNGKKIKIEGRVPMFTNAAGNYVELSIKEGAAIVRLDNTQYPTVTIPGTASVVAYISPTPGVHVYKLSVALFSGAGQTITVNTMPFMSVENE
ncbi:hypothetical protein QN355_19310 [Cryobacterium sp. 10S3]|uniref:hypothetical protein n=1 Tax=Cryobacterium sp. 10S3 TaxID=3048582 RepID=UPI002AC8B3C3|nr:hypothetical protein [Cryobacterium sp. 10S3]MEB0288682.1 hypothetical protein [Cryobacterium sp. 10S3]WPX14195.1 hypothetical protein RHM57_02130 [Cryobacterium sp. 10S3]